MLYSEKCAGILLPLYSFPSPYGVGDLGQSAYDVIDWIQLAGFKVLQVLPLHPNGEGDSPYAPLSTNAGNPLFIGFDNFLSKDLITEEELAPLTRFSSISVNYDDLIPIKMAILRRVFLRWSFAASPDEYQAFESFNSRTSWWLQQFADYMVLKEHFGGPYWTWPEQLRLGNPEAISNEVCQHSESLEFQFWLQWIFFTQWELFRGYANKQGVGILGDVPLYVSPDSVEAWSDKKVLSQDKVAGVPPDSFQFVGMGICLSLWGLCSAKNISAPFFVTFCGVNSINCLKSYLIKTGVSSFDDCANEDGILMFETKHG